MSGIGTLRPFWRYYGGKWRAAPMYPRPMLKTIIEPFAGAAGYAMRYPDRKVILVEKYGVIAEMWRYLIGVSETEVLSLPIVETLADLPACLPEGARHLIGFCLAYADQRPRPRLSNMIRRAFAEGRLGAGWGEQHRALIARQVQHIRHWQVIEGDYTDAPDIEATWFVDPPYNNGAGAKYKHNSTHLDYEALGRWAQGLRGQVTVCENEGADWLPFEPFATFPAGANGRQSREVIWTNTPRPTQIPLLRGAT